MSESSSETGEPQPVVASGHPDFSAGRSRAATGSGLDARGAAATHVTVVPSAQELDHRLRGLGGQPTDDVLAVSVRGDYNAHRRRGPLLAKVAVFVGVAALALALLRAYVIQPFSVPGDAMAPTVQAGDRILVLKSGLLDGPIYSGEIVAFRPPQFLPCAVAGGRVGDLVLRVVALPGEAISSVGNTIFVDGRPLRERGWYDRQFGPIGSAPIRSTTLAPDRYFVMADNRSDACDSRVFGPISKASVVGEGVAVVGRHGHVFFGTL